MRAIARIGLGLALLAGAAWSSPAARADEATEQRIEQLERRLATQTQELADIRDALAAEPPPPTPTASRLARGVAGLRWGGYVTLEYLGSTRRNSFFDLHRAILQLDGQITDCLDVSAEIEYEHGGIGGGRTGDVEVEQFTVAWHLCEGFSLTFGAPLIPFGRFNFNHDDPLNDFTARPWTGRYLVPTGFAQPGVGAFGAFPVGCGVLSYDVLLSTGFDDGFTPSGGVRDGRQAWNTDNNESKQLWGRVAYTQSGGLFDHLEVGLSGTWSRYDDADDNDLFGFATDWLVRKGPFELQGEWIRHDIERDALDPAGAVRGQDALWVQLAYHFFPCAWRDCRNCLVQETSHFTLAVRYQTMDLHDRVRGAHFNDDLRGYAVALNYRLSERTALRLDHQWLEPANGAGEREWSFSFSTYF